MRNFLETTRAVVIAAPLAIASVPASGNEIAESQRVGVANSIVSATKYKTEIAVSRENAKAPKKQTVFEQDFRSEVRHYLEREKCYVISNAPKNASSWLAAIGKFDTVNERAQGKYGKKTALAIEKAKDLLEAERQKAKVPFWDIMDPDRAMNDRERKCLA